MRGGGVCTWILSLLSSAAFLLHAQLPVVTANIRITQTKLVQLPDGITPTAWPVEGVATIELGGQTLIGYYMDCFSNANDGSQLTWTRVLANNPFEVQTITNGSRMAMTALTLQYTALGEYQCMDGATGTVAVLNITDVNPAVCPQEDPVEALVNHQAELSVFVSTIDGPLLENRITWRWPNGDIIESSDARVTFQTSHRRLILSGLTTNDTGSYVCEAVHNVGLHLFRKSTAVQLKVFVPSSFTLHPSPATINEWENVDLSCSATGSTPLTIMWKRTGSTTQLPVNSNIHEKVTMANGGTATITSTLTISQLHYADGGHYFCQAHNQLTVLSNTIQSQHVELTVSPVIRIENSQIKNDVLFASEGTTLKIDCFGSGTLSWLSTANITIAAGPSGSIYTISDPSRSELSLHIPNWMSSLVGTYTCMSDLLPGLENSIFVTNVLPVVFIQEEKHYALEGDTLSINASIHSTSQVSVEWYRNGTLLDPVSDHRYTVVLDGSHSMLTILRFEPELMGRYEIVVFGANGRNSTDGVNVLLPGPATATIVPSLLEVRERERAELTCNAGGSQPFEIMWLLGDGSSVLPDGVSISGSRLVITTTQRFHSNTYFCVVSNIAGRDEAAASISVVYPPTANITSSLLPSSTHTYTLSHGDGGTPSFTCSADGNPTPAVSWQRSGGAPLPSGVVQQAVEGVGQRLSWTRPLSYADSAHFECVAVNKEGESIVAMEIIVVFDPVIDTIFPAPGVSSTGESAIHYSVPLEFTGPALTCIGFGWPPPSIRWTKDSGALPSGVSSVVTKDGGIVRANLTFSAPFSASFIGMYKCTVAVAGSQDGSKVFQLVELFQGSSQGSAETQDCGAITSDSALFEFRVLSTGCSLWPTNERAQIAEEFESLLHRTVLSVCNCDVISEHISVISLACSKSVDGAVLFRGSVQTNSASLTGAILCSLSRWQMGGAVVSVNRALFAVDTHCSLELDSYAADECMETTSSSVDLNMILVIAIPSSVVFSICILGAIVAVYSFRCYCRRKRGVMDGDRSGTPAHTELQSFTRTESGTNFLDSSATHQHVDFIPGGSLQNTNPYYEDTSIACQLISQEHRDAVSMPEMIPLVVQQNVPPFTPPYAIPHENEAHFTFSSSERRVPWGSDSPPHAPLTATVSMGVQPYLIPTGSTANLNKLDRPGAGAANPVWGTGDYSPPWDSSFSKRSPSKGIGSRGQRRFSEDPPVKSFDHSDSSVSRSQESAASTARSSEYHLALPGSKETLNTPTPLTPRPSTETEPPPYSHLQFGRGTAPAGGGRGGGGGGGGAGTGNGKAWYESSSEVSSISGVRRPTPSFSSYSRHITPYACINNYDIDMTSPITPPLVPPTSTRFCPQSNTSPRTNGHYNPGNDTGHHGNSAHRYGNGTNYPGNDSSSHGRSRFGASPPHPPTRGVLHTVVV